MTHYHAEVDKRDLLPDVEKREELDSDLFVYAYKKREELDSDLYFYNYKKREDDFN